MEPVTTACVGCRSVWRPYSDYLFGYVGQSLGINGSFTLFGTSISWLALFTYSVCAAFFITLAIIIEPRLRQKTA